MAAVTAVVAGGCMLDALAEHQHSPNSKRSTSGWLSTAKAGLGRDKLELLANWM